MVVHLPKDIVVQSGKAQPGCPWHIDCISDAEPRCTEYIGVRTDHKRMCKSEKH